MRRARDKSNFVVAVCNFTPVVRENYRVGVPEEGFYREILNTDSQYYEGSGNGNEGGVNRRACAVEWAPLFVEDSGAAARGCLLQNSEAVVRADAETLRSLKAYI